MNIWIKILNKVPSKQYPKRTAFSLPIFANWQMLAKLPHKLPLIHLSPYQTRVFPVCKNFQKNRQTNWQGLADKHCHS